MSPVRFGLVKVIHQDVEFGIAESIKTLAFPAGTCLKYPLYSLMKMLPPRLVEFLQRKDNPFTQFVKYVFCGGTAVAIDTVVFYLLAWLVFPCMRASDPVARFLEYVGLEVRAATEEQLQTNYLIIKAFCFIVSNSVVYLLNTLFVFEPGRHRKPVEVALFFGGSLLQFVFIWIARLLIQAGWEVTYSNLTMLVVGIIVNYFFRKFLVFKR